MNASQNILARRDTSTLPRLFRKRGADQASRRLPPARIAVFGLFGCGNLGNDGSLDSMLQFLREARPETKLFCVCYDPDLVGKAFDVEALPISWSRRFEGRARKLNKLFLKVPGKLIDLFRTFAEIRRADVVVIPGTGILDDFGERPWGMPLEILRWCVAARLTGAKLVMVSIGAGPINQPLSRRLMLAAAGLANYRSYRDVPSREFMGRHGFDASRDPIYPDIVFKLGKPDVAPKPVPGPGERLTVGLGLMSYYGWYGFAEGGQKIFDTYVDKLSTFAVHLLDRGHNLRLLTGELTDQIAVDALRAKIKAVRPSIDPARIDGEPSHSLRELMGQMAATDMVVATRFHNVVCALKLGKPAISLGYSKKNDAVMADMGLGSYCQHVEHFSVDTLIAQFDELSRNLEPCAAQIREQDRRFAERLDQQNQYLLSTYL